MTDQKATLRSRAGAAAILLLASAPLTFMATRLYSYLSHDGQASSTFALYEVERFLVELTIALLLCAVISKRLTGTMVTVSLWIAGIVSQFPNIAAFAHGLQISDLPHSLTLGDTGLLLPSHLTMMVCTGFLICLMCMIPFKRLRSLDRLYVVSIGTFVLATTAIFSSTLNGGMQQLPIAGFGGLGVISIPQYNAVTDQFRAMLATLCITVHAAWILASLIGLAIHKNNIALRRREQRTIDDFVEKRFYEFIQG